MDPTNPNDHVYHPEPNIDSIDDPTRWTEDGAQADGDAVSADFDCSGAGEPDAELFQLDLAAAIPEARLGSDHSLLVDLTSAGIEVPSEFVPSPTPFSQVANEIWADAAKTPGIMSAPDTLPTLPPDFAETAFAPIESLWQVHGTPAEDMALWDPQDDPLSCAVATANMMFRSVGLDPGESVLAEVFQDLGVYDPAFGSDPDLLAEAMNAVAAAMGSDHRAAEMHGFGLDDLKQMLDDGVRPLLAVDATELVNPRTTLLNSFGLIPDSGHAVQLTGLIESPDGMVAVLNDPTGGAGMTVPVEALLDAAGDFGFTAVALV